MADRRPVRGAPSRARRSDRHKLVEHNLRLVAHIVKKYQNTALSNDDLISIGTIGLIKAVNSFLPKKGTQLATYAAKCIENVITSYSIHYTKLYEIPLIQMMRSRPGHILR